MPGTYSTEARGLTPCHASSNADAQYNLGLMYADCLGVSSRPNL